MPTPVPAPSNVVTSLPPVPPLLLADIDTALSGLWPIPDARPSDDSHDAVASLVHALRDFEDAAEDRFVASIDDRDDDVPPPLPSGVCAILGSADAYSRYALLRAGRDRPPVTTLDLAQAARTQAFLLSRFGTDGLLRRLVNTLRGFSAATRLVPSLAALASAQRRLLANLPPLAVPGSPVAHSPQPDASARVQFPTGDRMWLETQVERWRIMAETSNAHINELDNQLDDAQRENEDLERSLTDQREDAEREREDLKRSLADMTEALRESESELARRPTANDVLEQFGRYLETCAISSAFDFGTWRHLIANFIHGEPGLPCVFLPGLPGSGTPASTVASATPSRATPSPAAAARPPSVTPQPAVESDEDVVLVGRKRIRGGGEPAASSKRIRPAAVAATTLTFAQTFSESDGESSGEDYVHSEPLSANQPPTSSVATPLARIASQLIPTSGDLVRRGLVPVNADASRSDRGWASCRWNLDIDPTVTFGTGPFAHTNSNLVSEKSMGGWPVQNLSDGLTRQTANFPYHSVAQNQSAAVMASYGGVETFDELVAARMWDDMWKDRIRHLYLHDPRKFDEASLAWIRFVLFFQFQYRQAAWDHLHWLHTTSRKSIQRRIACGEIDQGWLTRYVRRDALNALYRAAFDLVKKAMPDTFPQDSRHEIWYEPGLWFCPTLHAVWAPSRNVSLRVAPTAGAEPPIVACARQVDATQPLRNNYAGAVGRMHETLSTALGQRLLQNQQAGNCWSFPAPYDQPDPFNCTQASSMGSPGPDYYSNLANPWSAMIDNFEKARKTGVQSKTRLPLDKLAALLFPALPTSPAVSATL